MPDYILKLIFLSGLIAAEVIRAPHRRRNRQDRKKSRIGKHRSVLNAFSFS